MFHEYTLSVRQPHDVHQGARQSRPRESLTLLSFLWDKAFKIGNGGGRKS